MNVSHNNAIKCASALSEATHAGQAVEEMVRQVRASLDGASVDFLLVFISLHYGEYIPEMQKALIESLRPKLLAGCTAGGVIGAAKELEGKRSISVFAAHMPEARVQGFYLSPQELEARQTPEDWRAFFNHSMEDPASFFIFPDPFSFDVSNFLALMDKAYPHFPIMGGLASAAMQPGQNILMLDEEQYSEGAVGLLLSGGVEVRSLVSQGCRPFGEPFIITGATENVIQELAGRPAMAQLEETYRKASRHDQRLAQRALFVGCAVDEYKQKLQRGDFVIRNVMSVDPESGAMAIGDYVRIGQTVQFHVRDAGSAREDLSFLCLAAKEAAEAAVPSGALMFNCNGRGRNMFQKPHHDISLLHESLGMFPSAGFFCAGEIGPIGKQNFLHGFTSSIALFYPRKHAAGDPF